MSAENERLAVFAAETATYFEHRPIGGEDAAFWSNVSNAEKCRHIAAALRSTPGPAPTGTRDEVERDRNRLADYVERRLAAKPHDECVALSFSRYGALLIVEAFRAPTAPPSPGEAAELIERTAEDILRKHTGQTGGCPRIDWYGAKWDIADALAASEAREVETIRSSDAVCDSYAQENQRLFDRAEKAEGRASRGGSGSGGGRRWYRPISRRPRQEIHQRWRDR
ncbi:hypothetical protein [uncultured Enterovirga sp.]|uniref:hypothetical protein n=1 Tax=uncultured Enterovirga sp. TaxID=2026352 RepID=UPI0035C96F48